jgi:hypothetical protein
MNDNFDTDPIDRILNRHRVPGPPHELRQRIVRTAQGRPRVHAAAWAPALAAAALIILFYTLANSIRSDLAARMPADNELPRLDRSFVLPIDGVAP